MSVTRIGQASVLLDLGGFRVLLEALGRDATDLPWWPARSARASAACSARCINAGAVAVMARKLGTGERRLQRRLREEGNSFQAVLEEARHQLGFTRSS